jgi:peptidoglycan/LPS O-acetylase OafA/YrhL
MIREAMAPASVAPPRRAAERLRIRPELALDLVLCGALAAGLPFLARHFQPDLPRRTVVLGLVGGGLCVLWSRLGRLGLFSRVGAMVTLAAVAFLFLFQAVQSWPAASTPESRVRMAATLMVVLAVFCVGTLANLTKEGEGGSC